MTTVAHTDGSFCQSRKRGGWAAVFEDKVVSGGCVATDSYTMELRAVVEAVKAAEGPVTVFCDHAGIVHAFARRERCKKDHALWLELYEAAEGKEVSLVWLDAETPEHRLAHRTAKDEACRGR